MTTESTEEHQSAAQGAEHLDGQTNFSGINIGGNTVTQATEWMPEKDRLQVRWLHQHARDKRWSWADLVREVGGSNSTWHRIFTDKYRYPKGHAREAERMPVEKWIRAIREYRGNAVDFDEERCVAFAETSVYRRIEWLCSRVLVRHRVGLIYGESQIGKSTALIEFARRNNHGQTVYMEVPPAGGVQFLTRTIAQALHVNTKTSFDNLLTDIIAALDSSKLLVVDEIHRVFSTYQKSSVMKCLDVLRAIHDRSKCGLVLCGTNVWRDQLTRGEFMVHLRQLRRRGASYELQLPTNPPRADLDLIAKQFGLAVPDGEAEEIMLGIARQHGFGVFCARLEDSAEYAAKRKTRLTWDHFVKVHRTVEKLSQSPEVVK